MHVCVCVCVWSFFPSVSTHAKKQCGSDENKASALRRGEQQKGPADRAAFGSVPSKFLALHGGAPRQAWGVTGSSQQANGVGLDHILSSFLNLLTTGPGFCSDAGREKT